jgi:hypothetical protein
MPRYGPEAEFGKGRGGAPPACRTVEIGPAGPGGAPLRHSDGQRGRDGELLAGLEPGKCQRDRNLEFADLHLGVSLGIVGHPLPLPGLDPAAGIVFAFPDRVAVGGGEVEPVVVGLPGISTVEPGVDGELGEAVEPSIGILLDGKAEQQVLPVVFEPNRGRQLARCQGQSQGIVPFARLDPAIDDHRAARRDVARRGVKPRRK